MDSADHDIFEFPLALLGLEPVKAFCSMTYSPTIFANPDQALRSDS
jgi:hypothetical protein